MSTSSDVSVRLDNVIIDDTRQNGNITYVIKPGDTLESIAQDVSTTIDNIRRVNNIAPNTDVNSKGTIANKDGIALSRLTISQLPGIVVAMNSTTSVREFAKQYNLNEDDIKSLNNIADSKTTLHEGDEIFLTISEHDAIKKWILADPNPPVVAIAAAPTPVKGKPILAVKQVTKAAVAPAAKATAKIVSEQNGIIDFDEGTILSSRFQKDLGYAGFAKGYCTSYAASRRKDIFGNDDKAFRGNASSWLSNAKKAGNATGKTPKVWSIAVFAPGKWASSYGHVAIVEQVDASNGKIVITDMNYKWRNIVTKRVIDPDSAAWYIY